MPKDPGLFQSVQFGSMELPNRIVMSPMTRIRADEGCVPSDRMVRYYAQRASAGLIITEGTHPSAMGRGYTYLEKRSNVGFTTTGQICSQQQSARLA